MEKKIDQYELAKQMNGRRTQNKALIVKMQQKIKDLEERIEKLEDKPKRGRPPKEQD